MHAHPRTYESPQIILDPGEEYRSSSRKWQGIPGIERAPGGRLWATWYTGGEGEGPGNHVVLVTSADDGKTWTEPVLVVAPDIRDRAFDPCLWTDPKGRLWLFWAKSCEKHYDGYTGVWAVRTDDADAEKPTWTPPRRLCNGIMMNKPTVLSSGEWLLPVAVWQRDPRLPELADEQFPSVVCSTDEGQTWERRGGADVPERTCDEHMIVERRDGSLWMLVRTAYGIGESLSTDGGFTWRPGSPSGLWGPNSRFFIRRLDSGRLVLVNHDEAARDPENPRVRSHLTAWLSEDDGRTWDGGLLLDERTGVSYPDGFQAPDGRIYITYDRNRGDRWASGADKEILLAVFREEDVLEGRAVSPDVRLKQIINRV